MNVPKTDSIAPADVLETLASELEELTPELRKAASYVLDNPNDVSVSSIREIADAAGVKPNTFVRMARSVGFEGYEDFRHPFREAIRRRGTDFPDRARWLQSLSRGGQLGELFAEMAACAISNIENTFAATDADAMKCAADAIVNARHTYVLGVGVNNSNARNFTYLSDMAVDTIWTIPRMGSVATDDLARADERDVLVAMTCKPYRTDVIDAVDVARELGLTIIAISDSAASPIVVGSDHAFIIDAETPQFFPSSVSTIALLETLLAFVIADAPPEVIASIERFHNRRHAMGLYQEEWKDR
ncbi:MurR/RpiR family transcriptional regulator [Roseibium denhamense]|nr:MurR/RpiR family transcriptional regulator [Roseibium denhamense]MTI06665.1 MurR/RpiR family transcriptional regulator [Roseibium denhamense]